jgi:hypothetical protein
VNCIGEEVARVSDQENQTALDLGISPHVCEFQQQTGADSYHDTDQETAEEHQHKHADGLEETQDCQLSSLRTRLVFLRRLEKHDGDGVVQNRFAEDDGV